MGGVFVLAVLGTRRIYNRPPAKIGVWLSLVEHLVRDEGVAGSNAAPTSALSRR